jgi:exonuclease SbcD
VIRLAHISDSHFDERGRLQDVVDVHDAFLRQAAARGVDAILHAGDWFERRSTPAERLAVADFLFNASQVAPVLGVKGNHDAALDLDLFPRLENEKLVSIADRPTAQPGSARVFHLGGGHAIGFVALPWFDKAHLVAGLDATVDQSATRELTITAARHLLTCLRAEATRLRQAGVVPVLAAHVLVAGSEVSTGQTLIGTTVELAPGDLLDVGAAYAALGHVHMNQAWFDGRVAYSGSPHRCNFGEKEPKGWRLVTLSDDGEFVSNEFIELPARRMVFLEHDATRPQDLADLTAATIRDGNWPDLQGALVRLRYRIKPQDLHLVDEQALEGALFAQGAEEVQLEAIVEHETRQRAPGIVQSLTTAEKVAAWMRAKAITVDEATLVRLRDKLALLEGETRAAA